MQGGQATHFYGREVRRQPYERKKPHADPLKAQTQKGNKCADHGPPVSKLFIFWLSISPSEMEGESRLQKVPPYLIIDSGYLSPFLFRWEISKKKFFLAT